MGSIWILHVHHDWALLNERFLKVLLTFTWVLVIDLFHVLAGAYVFENLRGNSSESKDWFNHLLWNSPGALAESAWKRFSFFFQWQRQIEFINKGIFVSTLNLWFSSTAWFKPPAYLIGRGGRASRPTSLHLPLKVYQSGYSQRSFQALWVAEEPACREARTPQNDKQPNGGQLSPVSLARKSLGLTQKLNLSVQFC